ncbi:SIMPL domain-containing protein [Pseudoxanthomonas japonensis]|uniref:SIMPL domain-containing protein n=1 Tax=Pseudoxanthomonas japonensis TaxID=69284 RepID=UPI001BD02B44|nr:SIMPL domain-containing protein [Pseudoxanthomonas japonensis]
MRLPLIRPLLLALTLSLGTTAAMTSSAQTLASIGATLPEGTLLNVSAQAEASRVPDIATISAGVVTQAVDGNTAMRQNSEQMAKVVAAIKAAGIADKDVQTSGISLNPQYRYAENEAPKITGYQANNTVSVKVRDIAKLGKVLDALAGVGANQINGPSFEIDNPEPVYDEARLAALKKAQARAETYAKSLGLKVRRIVSISEGNGGFRPMPMMAMAKMEARDASGAPPVSPGETTVSINLDVVFELGK